MYIDEVPGGLFYITSPVWISNLCYGFFLLFSNNPNPKEQVPDFPKPEIKAVIFWNGMSRGPLCQIPKEKIFAATYGQKNTTLRILSALASFVMLNIIHRVLSSVQAPRSRCRLIEKSIRSEGIDSFSSSEIFMYYNAPVMLFYSVIMKTYVQRRITKECA